MKTFFTFVLVLFLAVDTFATAQQPDKIIYNGTTYDLHSNPLEAYFEKNPDKKSKSSVISSALWRGYVAILKKE